jgi:tetratricopeptide (TPR) repeat protein
LSVARKHGLLVLLLLASLASSSPPCAAHVRLTLDQDEVTEHFRAAQDAMRAGRFDTAIDEFKRVLRDDPGLVEAKVNLGLAYHAVGDYELAAAQLSEAVKQRPDLLPANLFLGLSCLKLGDTARPCYSSITCSNSIPPIARRAARSRTRSLPNCSGAL